MKGGSREEGGGEGRRVSVGELFSGTRSHCRAEMDTGELLRKEEAWTGGQTCAQAEMAPQVQAPSLPEESVLRQGSAPWGPAPSALTREAEVAVPLLRGRVAGRCVLA